MATTPQSASNKATSSHPTHVLCTVLGREAQVLVEAGTQVVPVEYVCRPPATDEIFFDLASDGGLARTGVAGQPDGASGARTCAGAIVTRDPPLVPVDVGHLRSAADDSRTNGPIRRPRRPG